MRIIQQAPLVVFAAMIGLPLLVAAAAGLAARRARRRAAAVRAFDTTPIGLAEDGDRRFEGLAEAVGGEPLTSPLTGLPCVWYSATLEIRKRRSTRVTKETDWELVKTCTSSAPLLVRDASGACLVRPIGGDVTPTDTSCWTGLTPEPEIRDPLRVRPTDATFGQMQVTGGRTSRYRYTEACIYAGDPLMVTGRFSRHRFDTAVPDVPATREAAHDWDEIDIARHEALTRRGADITRAEIRRGDAGEPFILAAMTADALVALSEIHGRASSRIAMVALCVAAALLLVRLA